MTEKPPVRKFMDGRQIKGSERLLKSERQYLCHICFLFSMEISSKSSALVLSQILRLFVNLLKPDEKCPLLVKAGV